MIRAILYNPSTGKTSVGGEELRELWKQEAQSCLWMDFVDHPPESETMIMHSDFGLHLLAIEDAQKTRHPPKIESFKDHTFILLKGLSADTQGIQFSTHQLAVFIGERFLITHHTKTSPTTDLLFEDIKRDPQLFSSGPGALALHLCRSLIERYLRILLDVEPRLDKLEDEVIEHPRDAILAELLSYKTDLKKFKRVFLYHELVFQELRNKVHPGFNQELIHDIKQQERASSLASLYYELASDLAEGYISVASHHLNQIMKVLTIVMSIFVPLSFLAGIYGMNFENMPELHSKSGYYILLGVMISISVALLIFFRKKRWL